MMKFLVFISILSSIAFAEVREDVLVKLIDDMNATKIKVFLLKNEISELKTKIADLESRNKPIVFTTKNLGFSKAIVISWALTVREKPDIEAKAIDYLTLNQEIAVLQYNNEWSKLDSGGYIKSCYILKTKNANLLEAITKKNSIVRREPVINKQDNIVSIKTNQKIKVFSKMLFGGWYLLSDKSGYIYKFSLKFIPNYKKVIF